MIDFYIEERNVVNRLYDEWKKYGKIIIAYDYDDTVFDFHSKGRKYNNVISLLQMCREIGAYFVVFTACNENKYDDIREYLLTNDIPFDKINENLDFIPFTGRKVYFNILLDDRAGLKTSYDCLLKVANKIKEER